ncbi:MAG: RNA polymerase sigma factor [bacterium]|nr:RNA polymerase sigma factor [bacterium]
MFNTQSIRTRWLKQWQDRRRSQPEPGETPARHPLENGREQNETMDTQVKKIWKEAFKGFYKKHSRPLWFYIFKTCRDEQLADDILQESFYRYLRAEPIKLNEYQQKAYLYKIATNLTIDHLRKVKRTMERDRETEKDPYGERGFEECQQHRAFLSMDMDKLFEFLKPKERTLLWLAYVEGYSHREIARITGVTEKSVKVKLFRTRKKFAGILQEKGYEPEGRKDDE